VLEAWEAPGLHYTLTKTLWAALNTGLLPTHNLSASNAAPRSRLRQDEAQLQRHGRYRLRAHLAQNVKTGASG